MHPNNLTVQQPLPIHPQQPAVLAWNDFDEYFAENPDMIHVGDDDDNMPGEQGLRPAIQQPAPVVNPGAPAPPSGRRTRCFPCQRAKKLCDRPNKIAAAQANGVDVVANPVCCSSCERKARNTAGFQAGFCVIDPATSLAAGFQGYLDARNVRYGRK